MTRDEAKERERLATLPVDKAHITASFYVGRRTVSEILRPTYVDLDERGVLRAVYR